MKIQVQSESHTVLKKLAVLDKKMATIKKRLSAAEAIVSKLDDEECSLCDQRDDLLNSLDGSLICIRKNVEWRYRGERISRQDKKISFYDRAARRGRRPDTCRKITVPTLADAVKRIDLAHLSWVITETVSGKKYEIFNKKELNWQKKIRKLHGVAFTVKVI